MKPYPTKRGNMPFYVRLTWSDGHVSEEQVSAGCIEDFGTSPMAAEHYIRRCVSVRRPGIVRAEVCDQSGVLGLIASA